MNPQTHQFERLDTPEQRKRAEDERWPQFAEGERVEIRGVLFTINKIMPRGMVLRIVKGK